MRKDTDDTAIPHTARIAPESSDDALSRSFERTPRAVAQFFQTENALDAFARRRNCQVGYPLMFSSLQTAPVRSSGL